MRAQSRRTRTRVSAKRPGFYTSESSMAGVMAALSKAPRPVTYEEAFRYVGQVTSM